MSAFRVRPADYFPGDLIFDIEAETPMDAAEEYARLDILDDDTFAYDDDGCRVRVMDMDGDFHVYVVAWVEHPKAWQDRAAESGRLRAVRYEVGS